MCCAVLLTRGACLQRGHCRGHGVMLSQDGALCYFACHILMFIFAVWSLERKGIFEELYQNKPTNNLFSTGFMKEICEHFSFTTDFYTRSQYYEKICLLSPKCIEGLQIIISALIHHNFHESNVNIVFFCLKSRCPNTDLPFKLI